MRYGGVAAVGCLCLFAALAPSASAAGPEPLSPSAAAARNDALLRDVCFAGPRHGWAVGDHGVIWATVDGGRNWRLQESGVDAPLYAVSFVDRVTGWAAGGRTDPFDHTSAAVVLSTVDGGRHWRTEPRLLLPAIHRLRFLDARRGWAVGGTSPLYPSGIFVSDVGGRAWQPLPGAAERTWLAAAFVDPHHGAVGGEMGSFAAVKQAQLQPPRADALGLRTLRALELVPPTYGWLAGDGGLVMMTGDGGASWRTTPGRLPDAARGFDFSAMSVRGPKCWIAGTPGTRVFHSPDAGHTWQVYATGQPLPIESLWMIDDFEGVAVGSLGTILGTSDGGRSWQRRRAGGRRAAILGVFGDVWQPPLEVFARLSGDEGYLGAVVAVARRDIEGGRRDRTEAAWRLQEAAAAVGVSDARLAWQFPARQPGLELTTEQLVDAWDAACDGQGLAALEAYLAAQIRIWRPDVVLTSDRRWGTEPALEQLVAEAVHRALVRAADPKAWPEQISLTGLEPWQVRKSYAVSDAGGGAPVEINPAQLAPRMGKSLADAALLPRALLCLAPPPAPASFGLRPLVSQLDAEPAREGIFAGVDLSPGGEARRELLEPAAETVEALARLAQRRRTAGAIVNRIGAGGGQGVQLAAQTGDLARGLAPAAAASLLDELAEKYHRSGQGDLAAQTYAELAERHADLPQGRRALVWLVQHFSSGEAAWRTQASQRQATGKTVAVVIDASRLEDRPARAIAWAARIEQERPDLFAEPSLRFPLASAHRAAGQQQLADQFFAAQTRGQRRDAWVACAAGEQWLQDRKAVGAKAVVGCPRIAARPRLDGRLDEPLWQTKPAALASEHGEDGQWPATIRWACDGEFLYLGVNCRKAEHARYDEAAGTRPRDADLTGRDRVDVFLDIDRDYATYWRLTVDYRGWTAESCGGDPSWNPRWFVAADGCPESWSIEAAVPLMELTGKPPAAGDAWAVGVQRTVPGVGFQSWSRPASTQIVPEGFGYLMFE